MNLKAILFGQVKIKNLVLLLLKVYAGYTIKTWDINWDDENQSFVGFPINGSAELDTGSNTKNIKAYIPKPGNYIFIFNFNNFSYSLDSTRTK